MKTENSSETSLTVAPPSGWVPQLSGPTLEGEPRLDELARLINQAYGWSLNYADGSRAAARYAIQSAVICGGYLRKVKAQPLHGQFGAWILRNTQIDPRTVRNYMRLHIWVGQHQKDILDHKPHSLRQFYILAGILPEDGPKRLPKDKPDELTKLRRLVHRTCLEAAAHRDYCTAQALLRALDPLAALLEEIVQDVDQKNRKHVSDFD